MNAPIGRLADSLTLPQPYLLFLGDTTEAGYAKTAFGLADWAADRCVGEWRSTAARSPPACRQCRPQRRGRRGRGRW